MRSKELVVGGVALAALCSMAQPAFAASCESLATLSLNRIGSLRMRESQGPFGDDLIETESRRLTPSASV